MSECAPCSIAQRPIERQKGLLPAKTNGGTSAPLVGNPGPKIWRSKRKIARENRKSKKRRKKLGDATKEWLIQSGLLGVPYKRIAKSLNISSKSVRVWMDRYYETGGVARKPGSGKPASLSARDQVRVKLISRRDRTLSAPKITQIINSTREKKVSVTTVKRCLLRFGLNGRVSQKKPYISAVYIQALQQGGSSNRTMILSTLPTNQRSA